MTWLLFLVTSAAVVMAGTWLARYGDIIAGRTGLGRAWVGLVLVAATTSLPELFTGASASAQGLVDIALGDAIGSCMFNLVIISLMDTLSPGVPVFARAQPGHALSVGFGVLLMGLVGVGMEMAERVPMVGGFSVVSIGLAAIYLVAARLLFFYERRRVAAHAEAVAEELASTMNLRDAGLRYAGAAVVLVAAATALPTLAGRIAVETGLGEALVGNLFVALTTSLPEMVVSIIAVRMGAIDLAMGNVLGSNLFNVFIITVDDTFYRRGAILAAAHPSLMTAVFGVLVMYGVVLVGLTYQVRTKKLIVNWDTGALAAVYAITIWVMYGLRGPGNG